jgi:hypothetical protein
MSQSSKRNERKRISKKAKWADDETSATDMFYNSQKVS